MPTRTALFMQKQPGGVFDIQDLEKHPNDVWFVNSTGGVDGAGYGRNPDSPFATLDYAIGNCTASKGDVIYVMPGHAETIAATDGFDVDLAGVKIIGLGWGSNRPTFTFSATASQVNIGAASVWLENLRFIAGVSAVVSGVQVEGKTDFVCKNCEWDYGGTTGWDFVISLELEAGSHRAIIEDNIFRTEPATAGPNDFISLVGVSNSVTIRNNQFYGDCAVALVLTNDASLHLTFMDNIVFNENDGEPYLETKAGTTGINANTRGYARVSTISDNVVGAAMAHCENFTVNTLGTHAIIKGAAGTIIADADS